jgi:hypothetical protein
MTQPRFHDLKQLPDNPQLKFFITDGPKLQSPTQDMFFQTAKNGVYFSYRASMIVMSDNRNANKCMAFKKSRVVQTVAVARRGLKIGEV